MHTIVNPLRRAELTACDVEGCVSGDVRRTFGEFMSAVS